MSLISNDLRFIFTYPLLLALPCIFHVARHTCATLLCHQGIPVTTVQKILGHTKLATTQIYMEVMADTMVRDLSEVWGKEKKQTEKTTGSIL